MSFVNICQWLEFFMCIISFPNLQYVGIHAGCIMLLYHMDCHCTHMYWCNVLCIKHNACVQCFEALVSLL